MKFFKSLLFVVLTLTVLSLCLVEPSFARGERCPVSSNSDSANQDFTLRNGVERGFNDRGNNRVCRDALEFRGNRRISMTRKLDIDNFGDENGLTITGATASSATIDTTDMSDDECAIEIHANHVTITGIIIKTKQMNLVWRGDEDADGPKNAVICDYGDNNNFRGADIDNSEAVPDSVCGNGEREPGEACDDDNTNNNDGCSRDCTIEPDNDGDGKVNVIDNCPDVSNRGQQDFDSDGAGDVCDHDYDNDDYEDERLDNCPYPTEGTGAYDNERAAQSFNPDQLDTDNDGQGDKCDSDDDGDNIADGEDECPLVENDDPTCDVPDPRPDLDGDDVRGADDNCPQNANPEQSDMDSDGRGDVCDPDIDNDGINNEEERRPSDGRPATDPEDPDMDDDGSIDSRDNCRVDSNADQVDSDADGVGDACDDGGVVDPNDPDDPDGPLVGADSDRDGVPDSDDNCPNHPNEDQAPFSEGRAVGAACDLSNPDADTDLDGKPNKDDNCATVANADQANADGDLLGDDCDPQVNEPFGADVVKSSFSCSLSQGPVSGALPILVFLISLIWVRLTWDAYKKRPQ